MLVIRETQRHGENRNRRCTSRRQGYGGQAADLRGMDFNRSPDYLRSSAVQIFSLCPLCLCGEFFGLVTPMRFFAERWR